MMKVQDLTGPALDWAVCKAGGGKAPIEHKELCVWLDGYTLRSMFNYSTDWSQGGPIIEREGIELLCNLTATEAARFSGGANADWQAFHRSDRRSEARQYAQTPLIAAMRCYVASKLGEEVDVPEELLDDMSSK